MNVSTRKWSLKSCDINPGKAWLSMRAEYSNAFSPRLVDAPSLSSVNLMTESQFDKAMDILFFGE